MQVKQNLVSNISAIPYYPTRLHELVYSELIDLNTQEMILIHEMIRLIRQPKDVKNHTIKTNDFSFSTVQEALKNVPANLSDDIISEREETL